MATEVMGIDVGTTRWVVNDKNGVIKDPMGHTTTPSYIGWHNNEFVYGSLALGKVAKFPTATFYDLKRLLARKWSKELAAAYPFPLYDASGKIVIRLGGEEYFPQDLIAKMGKYLFDHACTSVGHSFQSVVLCVPAAHGHLERAALVDSFLGQGINVTRCISEPTAAGINLVDSLDPDIRSHSVLIFDLGSVHRFVQCHTKVDMHLLIGVELSTSPF